METAAGNDSSQSRWQGPLAGLWQAQEPWEEITSLSVLSAFATDETDRGVDQQDGKNHMGSSECEESDASKEELLKTRLPTRSDMICGYACLRGILSSQRGVRGCTLRDVCFFIWRSDRGGYRVLQKLSLGRPAMQAIPRPSTVANTCPWLQGLLPCGTPNGVPGTLRPSLKCSPRGLVTRTWPTCL